jgi:integrase
VKPAAGWRCRYTQTVTPQAVDAGSDDVLDEQVKALTAVEFERLLGEIPDEWRLFYTFLGQTGLRISEAIELSWKDVNLATRQFTVTRRFYRGKVAPPKSKYGRRTIKFSEAPSGALGATATDDPTRWCSQARRGCGSTSRT